MNGERAITGSLPPGGGGKRGPNGVLRGYSRERKARNLGTGKRKRNWDRRGKRKH